MKHEIIWVGKKILLLFLGIAIYISFFPYSSLAASNHSTLEAPYLPSEFQQSTIIVLNG